MRAIDSCRPSACQEPDRNKTKPNPVGQKKETRIRDLERPIFEGSEIFSSVGPTEPTETEFGRGGERDPALR